MATDDDIATAPDDGAQVIGRREFESVYYRTSATLDVLASACFMESVDDEPNRESVRTLLLDARCDLEKMWDAYRKLAFPADFEPISTGGAS